MRSHSPSKAVAGKGRPQRGRLLLPPVWRLSDEQWTVVEPVVTEPGPPAEEEGPTTRACAEGELHPYRPPLGDGAAPGCEAS